MENDFLAMLQKYRDNVTALVQLEAAKGCTPKYLGALNDAILQAQQKVHTAEVTLVSMLRSYGATGPKR